MTVAGKQNRSFSAKYLKEYSWLEYSLEKIAVFCFCCRNLGCDDVDKVFTKTAFTNWKKVLTLMCMVYLVSNITCNFLIN